MLALAGALSMACSEPADGPEGAVVEPPFEVAGEAEGLLLVWYDDEGPHTATRRSAIPEAHRSSVRVDDLSLGPDEGLPAGQVYVADLTSAGEGGRYTVRQMSREAFDARVEAAMGGAPEAEPAATAGRGDAEVVIYTASWCGYCRQAKAFLREQNVPFVERDIEREPGAREAMQRAMRAAGVSGRGVPVIDFDGEIITGFDRAALQRAIERSRSPI